MAGHGRVHAGFYDALSHVWRDLEDVVRQFNHQFTKTVWVTGHSLGGALASLTVARWLDSGRPVHGMYTFGQPRTGDNSFARNFNFNFMPRAFRMVNNNDLVTRIPPRSFGFSHLGSFKYFTDEGNLEHHIGWWDLFLDSWQGHIHEIFSGDIGFGDHSMTGYRELVSRQVSDLLAEFDQRRSLEAFLAPRAATVTPRRRTA